ncbi:MAG: hypothetical protein JO249_24180, partial [Acidobacteria bacterium]|nr:hypothetical protein [Acidobacteriota bacterium]
MKLITFTGSAQVGWAIKRNSGKKNGSRTPGSIVHHDADLPYAADGFVGVQLFGLELHFHAAHFCRALGLTANSQTCSWQNQETRTSDLLEESTDPGPVIRESDAVRAADCVNQALQAG